MNPIDSFYYDLKNEFSQLELNLELGEIKNFLQGKKTKYYEKEELLELDALVVSKIPVVLNDKAEKELISMVKEYYQKKLDEPESKFNDGTTQGAIVDQNDIEHELDNYILWRKEYNKIKEYFSTNKISNDKIVSLHENLLKASIPGEVGKFRSIMNGIRGSDLTPSHPFEIEDHLNEALGDLKSNADHPIVRIVKFHHRFLTIHPFNEGNGRTIRELTNIWLSQLGLPVIDIPSSLDPAHHDRLKKADKGDISELLLYFCSIITSNL